MFDVVITGSGGFVGRALVTQLSRDGLKVFAMDRSHGDVADAKTWQSIPSASALIHLAGKSYVPDSWKQGPDFVRSNVLGTEHALAWCRVHGAQMILASAYVYGIPEFLPLREDHPVNPNNPYAMSKFLSEQLCEFAASYQNIKVTILRIFNIFGVGQREEFLIPSIVHQVRKSSEIHVQDLKPRRDYVFLDDVVSAISLALRVQTGFSRINIGSGVSYSVKEIIDIIQSEAEMNLPIFSKSVERIQEIPDVKADIEMAQQILRWSPKWTFRDGIRQIIKGACI